MTYTIKTLKRLIIVNGFKNIIERNMSVGVMTLC